MMLCFGVDLHAYFFPPKKKVHSHSNHIVQIHTKLPSRNCCTVVTVDWIVTSCSSPIFGCSVCCQQRDVFVSHCYPICFSKASLHEMEDNDLDALMADLVADISATEEKFATDRDTSKGSAPFAPIPIQPQSNFGISVTDTSKPATSSNSIAAPPLPLASKPSKVRIIMNGPHTHRPHVVNTSLAEGYRVYFKTRPNNRCEQI